MGSAAFKASAFSIIRVFVFIEEEQAGMSMFECSSLSVCLEDSKCERGRKFPVYSIS